MNPLAGKIVLLACLLLAELWSLTPRPVGVSSAPDAQCHPHPQAEAQPESASSPHPKAESGNAVAVSEKRLDDGGKVKTVLFRNLLIDRKYAPMTGPSQQQYLLLGSDSDPAIWITRCSAQVMEDEQFMCHAMLRLVGLPGSGSQADFPQVAISQGQREIAFPPGCALRIENRAERQFNLAVMVANGNQPVIHRQVSFETTLQYYGDIDARRQNLIPLHQILVYTAPWTDAARTSGGQPVCRPAAPPQTFQLWDGAPRTGHWVVPAGRQVITHEVTRMLDLQKDTTLHYIWMHVHPYAESMELRDATARKTLWKGSATNPDDARVARILRTSFYSSAAGMPLYASHRYELTTIYNNRSGHDIDAMAALWLYARQ